MSEHLDRATEVIAAHMYGMTTSGMCRGIARALEDAGLLVTPERDAEVRADERGRCSVIHATLTDEALVAELVRRGVLEADEYAEPCDWRCYVVTYDYEECRHVCRRSGPHVEHECVNGHTVAVGSDDAQPERALRYVTAWEPDTRTPQQRSDDAIDELRQRLTGDA